MASDAPMDGQAARMVAVYTAVDEYRVGPDVADTRGRELHSLASLGCPIVFRAPVTPSNRAIRLPLRIGAMFGARPYLIY
jgi:hypothetical protein